MEYDIIVREIMRYSYPVYAGASLCLALLELLWYIYLARTPIRLGRAVIYVLMSFTIALLAITAGANPVTSIDTLRPYIALLRVLTMIVMVVAIGIMLRPLRRMTRSD